MVNFIVEIFFLNKAFIGFTYSPPSGLLTENEKFKKKLLVWDFILEFLLYIGIEKMMRKKQKDENKNHPIKVNNHDNSYPRVCFIGMWTFFHILLFDIFIWVCFTHYHFCTFADASLLKSTWRISYTTHDIIVSAAFRFGSECWSKRGEVCLF